MATLLFSNCDRPFIRGVSQFLDLLINLQLFWMDFFEVHSEKWTFSFTVNFFTRLQKFVEALSMFGWEIFYISLKSYFLKLIIKPFFGYDNGLTSKA